MSAIPVFPPPGASIDTRRWAWLPPVGTWGYYTLLAAIGMLILGPLGGIAAAFMNFSIGFYVGGQVLAGILGSVVTYGYGAEGKHGANYIQTTAASVAGMMAMSTLIQAMAWMGMPEVPAWQLVTYMLCIGMMAAGIGMLYTPILVERMQLTFPSGLAVANILRALTDPVLLKQSVSRLFGGMGAGLIGGIGAAKIAVLGAIELSTSTFGAGLIVGARVGIPAIVGGGIFWALAPYFVSIGWLKEGEPFRKIAFLIALGMILGAAVVDLSLIFWRVARRLTQPGERVVVPEEQRTGPRASLPRLLAWVGVWTVATIVCGVQFFNEPLGYMILAVALVYLFVIVNGISLGLTDSNPISSAFVVTVLILASIGLKDPMLGLLAAMVVFVSASVAGDMQQDRSTGWRLGSNRTLQFRFQVAGLLLGSVLAVAVAKFFMTAYPVLQLDQTVMSADQAPAQWTSAMTYKFVGALRSLTEPKPYQTQAILIGVLIGFATELLRKIIKANKSYQRFAAGSKAGFATDFMLDAVVLPSPYASSFGGFVNLHTSMWFAAGGVISSAINTLAPKPKPGESELPSDMSSTSLVGGGLIAGDALAALGLGLAGMAAVLG
ncbi:OPT/YSL family transporter [Paucibacter sp. DJ2R-2]|uniref:OPT/YSL family transporter n=1 Tax=Paucibacter sp. DJ2R-2 TaxID=2893558 RepID=UPI0021E4BF8F|nr:OPT/YSL family transporter [Paucibacter sp. DJ2R-2]MCV2418976.1 OPT/YSL family transporter [Paucibacter sp. DJ4R-1]MCV2438069.1 OPT/YSL family transporter [Paucibacter sp. DJ2R-2]